MPLLPIRGKCPTRAGGRGMEKGMNEGREAMTLDDQAKIHIFNTDVGSIPGAAIFAKRK